MDACGITPKSGIWRASYRLSLADAIIACREDDACDAARHLARLGLETLARDLQRVRDDVMERLGAQLTVDSQLRRAVMDSVLDRIYDQMHSTLQPESMELVPVA
jgi:hypothetical protein